MSLSSGIDPSVVNIWAIQATRNKEAMHRMEKL